MPWTEWTATMFRGLDLTNLNVDQAYFNVSNADIKPYYLYSLSEECVKCPFRKLKVIEPLQETVIKLDVARKFEIRLFDKDVGDYVLPNETNDGIRWSGHPDFGQFGVYDLTIEESNGDVLAVMFKVAKEPVNIYSCEFDWFSMTMETSKFISSFTFHRGHSFHLLLDLQSCEQIYSVIDLNQATRKPGAN